MRFSRFIAVAALAIGPTALAQAQSATGSTLTLDEAIVIALRNNPGYLQTTNTRQSADAQVRSAYGALLPSSSASFSTRYQQGGRQVFNGLSFSSSSDALQSSYNLGLNYQINAATLIGPRAAAANRRAVEADITGAAETLRSGVTQQYITVLQADARAAVQDTLVITARGQLELANAKVAVGAGTALDVRTAEVAVGQAEVASLTAHNTAAVERLRLFQQLGVPPTEDVQLTTRFTVAQPSFSLDSVLDLAHRVNPAVRALQAREKASGMNVRVAQSQYTPTLSLNTGWGGQSFEYTDPNFLIAQAQGSMIGARASCFTEDSIRSRLGMPTTPTPCSNYVFTPDQAQAIRADNDKFPFNFTRSPFSVSATLSIPVFDGFNREQRVEEAQVARENAQLSLRASQLQLTGDVTQAYLNLVTMARTVELQDQIALKAREELAFAEERYRVGAATFLDVTTSRGTYEQAQIDRVNAVYDYHKAFAALESAVGRPLR